MLDLLNWSLLSKLPGMPRLDRYMSVESGLSWHVMYITSCFIRVNVDPARRHALIVVYLRQLEKRTEYVHGDLASQKGKPSAIHSIDMI